MAISAANSFGTRDKLNVGAQSFDIHRLEYLEKKLSSENMAKLPFSLRILLENLLRNEDGRFVRPDDIKRWLPGNPAAPKKKSRLCRPEFCCRILRECLRLSILRRCAKPSRKWAAIRSESIRCSLLNW